MKNFLMMGLLAVALTLSACGRIDLSALLEEDVAEIVEAAVAEVTGGLADHVAEITAQLEELSLEDLCDSTYSNSSSYTSPGNLRSSTYEMSWSADLICNSLSVPQSALLTYQAEGTYDTPRISSQDSSSFSGSITGLELTSPSTSWSGTYTQDAAQDLDFREERSILSKLEIDLNSLLVVKQSQEISSGAGTFSLEIEEDGETKSYAGSIVFLGNQTGTITINGETYPFQLD
ncbi:MAG: hypothetical protein AAFR61_16060 [Bacteroidota bacterium]